LLFEKTWSTGFTCLCSKTKSWLKPYFTKYKQTLKYTSNLFSAKRLSKENKSLLMAHVIWFISDQRFLKKKHLILFSHNNPTLLVYTDHFRRLSKACVIVLINYSHISIYKA
jgi:hypothetical protein